jgi:hypothetical protein
MLCWFHLSAIYIWSDQANPRMLLPLKRKLLSVQKFLSAHWQSGNYCTDWWSNRLPVRKGEKWSASLLSKYIAEEFLPWTSRFPREYYQEIFRLWDGSMTRCHLSDSLYWEVYERLCLQRNVSRGSWRTEEKKIQLLKMVGGSTSIINTLLEYRSSSSRAASDKANNCDAAFRQSWWFQGEFQESFQEDKSTQVRFRYDQ